MKKIKFVVDYRGVLTDEEYFEKGTVKTFADTKAERLVKDKRAEYVKSEPKEEK